MQNFFLIVGVIIVVSSASLYFVVRPFIGEVIDHGMHAWSIMEATKGHIRVPPLRPSLLTIILGAPGFVLFLIIVGLYQAQRLCVEVFKKIVTSTAEIMHAYRGRWFKAFLKKGDSKNPFE